jgi:Tfp pilus assembly PilM family ATPase
MSLQSYFTRATAPTVAVEISARHVAAARLDMRRGEAVVSAHASEPLPPNAVEPSLTVTNIHDRAKAARALAIVLERVGGPRRVGLIVPDHIAKVSLVRFEQVPEREQDLEQLVQWQMRKTAPFPLDTAQVAYARGAQHSDGQEFIVSVAKRDIIREYEMLLDDVGARAGIVDLSTFNVVNLLQAAASRDLGDRLLVNVAPDSATIAILRGPDLIFFRNRTTDADRTLADLVHQAMMYYEDRLGGRDIRRVLIAGAASAGTGAEADQLRRSLGARVSVPVESVDPRIAAPLTDRIVAAPVLLDTLAPLLGLMLREREQAA